MGGIKPYKVPAGEGEDILIEKKSRFIGHVYKVETVEEINEILAAQRKKYWDASHVVYAYILHDGTMRFSDDGEPQGTSGMPTLDVFRKEEVFDVLCTVVRYFGGTLLGAGGLVRAYGKTAKMALDAAGVAMMRPHLEVLVDCPYNLLEIVRKRFDAFDASEESAEFGASVLLTLYMPSEQFDAFSADIIDLTNGAVEPMAGEEKLFARRIK
ncbi:MAG: YigZ family protein [Clostridia bacterium]|nr:YigZ family protein [Clostridia bacterium]MBQ2325947.1 YigZ family protein [Clostridia bacterium]